MIIISYKLNIDNIRPSRAVCFTRIFLFSGFHMQLSHNDMKNEEDTDDKKKALFSCKDGIAGVGIDADVSGTGRSS